MNVDALLSIARRSDLPPTPIDRWKAAGLPGVELGHQLFASGELRRLAEDPRITIEPVLELLLGSYRDRAARAAARTPRRSAPTPVHQDATGPAGSRPLVLLITRRYP